MKSISGVSFLLLLAFLSFSKERIFNEKELINGKTILCIFHIDSAINIIEPRMGYKIYRCSTIEDVLGKTDSFFQIISGGLENSSFELGKTYLAYLIYDSQKQFFKAIGENNEFAREVFPDSTIMWRKSINVSKDYFTKFPISDIIQRAKNQFNKTSH